MRKPVIVVSTLVLALVASEALAQRAMSDRRLLFGVSGGYQVGAGDLEYQTTFPLYDETAVIDTTQSGSGGGFLDLSAGYVLGDRFGVGVAYNYLQSSGDATLTGTLPHPLFFDRPRSFTADSSDLSHNEQALHFQALWFVEVGQKLGVALSAGPSWFHVAQDVAVGVTFTETPPNYETVTIDSVIVDEVSGDAFGFNLGADATYAITDLIGAGVLIRYTYGTATLPLSDGQEIEVTAGGFQIGGGLRVRF